MEDKSLIDQLLVVLHFVPFIGPARYATEAIFAYMAGDEKKARDKGISSTINGLIDLLTVSLFLLSAAHIAVECDKSDNLRAIKPLLTTGAVVAVVSILVSLKIVAEQMSRAVVDRVLTVNTASSAVVNSVTITATGIEAVVGTVNAATNATTNTVKSGYSSARKTVKTVINTPKTTRDYVLRVLAIVWQKLRTGISKILQLLVNYMSKLMSMMLAVTVILFELFAQLLMKIVSKFLPDFKEYSVFRLTSNLFNNSVNALRALRVKNKTKTT